MDARVKALDEKTHVGQLFQTYSSIRDAEARIS
jgi:hypothetical protein